MPTVTRGRAAAMALAAQFVTLWVGCAQPYFAGPPAECRLLEVVVGDRGELHSKAGLYFEVANTSDREIVDTVIGFSLFGDGGVPVPRFGANTFRARITVPIHPGTVLALCTSLDDCLTAPVAGLSASRLRPVSVTYADGGAWHFPGDLFVREADS